MTDLRHTAIAAGVILLWVALFTAAVFVVCGAVTLLADWFATAALPAIDAWLKSDPVRTPALLIGAMALICLVAVRVEVGE